MVKYLKLLKDIKKFIYAIDASLILIFVLNFVFVKQFEIAICLGIGILLLANLHKLYFKACEISIITKRLKQFDLPVRQWRKTCDKYIEVSKDYIYAAPYIAFAYAAAIILFISPLFKDNVIPYLSDVNLSPRIIDAFTVLASCFMMLHIIWFTYLCVAKTALESYKDILIFRLKKERAKLKIYEERLREEYGYHKIEDIFLVYKSGLLISHITLRIRHVDSRILTSMLTAIQDFVKDSFKYARTADTTGIDKLKYGDLTILIEYGEYAYIATVITGEESGKIRYRMKRALTAIHRKYKSVLPDWSGDMGVVRDAVRILERIMLPPSVWGK